MDIVLVALPILNMLMDSVYASMDNYPIMESANLSFAEMIIKFGIQLQMLVNVEDLWFGCWVNANILSNVEKISIGLVQLVHAN